MSWRRLQGSEYSKGPGLVPTKVVLEGNSAKEAYRVFIEGVSAVGAPQVQRCSYHLEKAAALEALGGGLGRSDTSLLSRIWCVG